MRVSKLIISQKHKQCRSSFWVVLSEIYSKVLMVLINTRTAKSTVPSRESSWDKMKGEKQHHNININFITIIIYYFMYFHIIMVKNLNKCPVKQLSTTMTVKDLDSYILKNINSSYPTFKLLQKSLFHFTVPLHSASKMCFCQ